MKVLDLNVLLYAVNRDSPRHEAARAWLESTLSGEETVASRGSCCSGSSGLPRANLLARP